jgi:Dolichyl-phosphate-mannose-protein mannosyltransferase
VSSQTFVLPGRVQRVAGYVAAARARLLAVRPLYVLAALLAVQWIGVLILAFTVRHNGWVYYMGGDQLWHYTLAYLIVHGHLAPTYVGVGWPTILAPIAAVAGPNLVSAMPAIILFNTLVLVPLGLACMYGIGERIAGRMFGYWTALLWVAIPFIGSAYALRGYHQKWTELTLPTVTGLSAMSDFPSMIFLVAGAYLCLRSIDERHWVWAAGAGFAVGFAIAIKPSSSVFLIAPALLYAVTRWRSLVPFALGLVPCLATLAVWKVRGEGNLPWRTTAPAQRLAVGPGGIVHRYLRSNTWTQLHNNLLQIREHLYSDRILEFLVVAGLVALIVRSRRAALFIGSWFVVFLLLKGTYVNSRVEDGTFWRLLLPAFPAFVVLSAAVTLLVPGVRLRRLPAVPWRLPRRLVVAASAALVAVLSLFPIALLAATKPIRGPYPSALEVNSILVSEAAPLDLRATPSTSGGVVLRWRSSRPSTGGVFYSVFRNSGNVDTICGPVKHAPDLCEIHAQELSTTRTNEYVDHPGAGTWTYRVGITANWLNDTHYGDVYVFGRPATVTVRS